MLLVTGAVGMAGWHIVREALAQSIPVQGIWHSESPIRFSEQNGRDVPMHCCELADIGKVKELITRLKPTAIIHCAGLTNVDGCEDDPEHAMNINARGSGALAAAAAEYGARFVHFSTDSVYDGSRPGWQEEDETKPLNVYGESKVEAERLILEAHPDALVLRTNFYGKHPCDSRALAGWIISRLEEGNNVPGFTDVIFSPLWIGHLARLVIRLAWEGELKSANGVMNLVGQGSLSKFDFAKRVAAIGGYDENLVTPSLSTDVAFRAKRPLDTSLNVQKATALLGALPTMDEGIEAFVADLSSRDGIEFCSVETTGN